VHAIALSRDGRVCVCVCGCGIEYTLYNVSETPIYTMSTIALRPEIASSDDGPPTDVAAWRRGAMVGARARASTPYSSPRA